MGQLPRAAVAALLCPGLFSPCPYGAADTLACQDYAYTFNYSHAQQNHATACGVREVLPAAELVEDALRMNAGALERHEVEIVREYTDVPPLPLDKHKFLQVLVNLISNAKYALDGSPRPDKRLTLRVGKNGPDRVRIAVIDNGIGIAPENITRIFAHGFTTRKGGHGFGLHSAALAAREMGGTLGVQSDGLGRGAAFTLELPRQQPAADA